MHVLYNELLMILEQENKEKALEFASSKLSGKELDIVTLYTELLAPALNNMRCEGTEEFCIWKEHVRSSIVRAIIENCYLIVIRERNKKYNSRDGGEKVMVICPPDELHEIGARMVADFFTLLGYAVTFVGANTPRAAFLSAVETLKPEYIAISVTNYYNLIAAQKVIRSIRETKHGKVRIIVGGQAFEHNPKASADIGADLLVRSFNELKALRGGA